MTIKLRFALLLGLLLGGFLVAVLLVRGLERDEMDAMLATDRQARVQLLNHWIDLTGRALPQFAGDTAQSEELAAALRPAFQDETRKKLERSLAAAGLCSLWIVRDDASIVFEASTPIGATNPFPLKPADFAALVAETPNPRFFAEQDQDLLEVCIRRIQPGRTSAMEWLVVARRWDEPQLRALARLVEADVSLRAAHETVPAPQPDAQIVLLRPLNDWQGHPLRVLHVKARALEIENAVRIERRQSQIFIVFGLLVIAAMGIALGQWVLQPLGTIRESLVTENPRAVASLSQVNSELGQLARLVEASFAHRQQLQREIDERKRIQQALQQSETTVRHNLAERERLGRDLHDGIIQSLYAAGMGLAGIRMLLKPDQEEAATRLEQTRAALNEMIHDVRNFIIGLEPEALKMQTFEQAVTALLDVMRRMRAFRSIVTIDESLAARLTLAQRVHALQITREAVSNALRHGQAGNVRVALRPSGEFVEFEVVDDGSGFDAGNAVPQGKGLANFAQRAHELGAELHLKSEAGSGTQVRLVFSLINL